MTHQQHRAGFTPLVSVAAHWRVDTATARTILDAAGVRPLLRKRRRLYAWTDIWRLEGAGDVAPDDVDAFQAPLLTKRDIAERYGLSERTARRWLTEETVPAIRLSERVLRARAITLDRDDDGLAASSPANADTLDESDTEHF
jgi:transcriptional regulator with XRE-family HTH domain